MSYGGRGGGGRGRGRGGARGGRGSGRGGRAPTSANGGIWKSKLTCFGCRGTGHTIRDCRKVKGGAAAGRRGEKSCYNCGASDHSANACDKPWTNYAHAKCFVCDKVGHLSRACPENAKGVYVNGGSCKICGAVDHLVKDCPKNNARRAEATVGEEGAVVDEEDEDEGRKEDGEAKTKEAAKRGRREVVF